MISYNQAIKSLSPKNGKADKYLRQTSTPCLSICLSYSGIEGNRQLLGGERNLDLWKKNPLSVCFTILRFFLFLFQIITFKKLRLPHALSVIEDLDCSFLQGFCISQLSSLSLLVHLETRCEMYVCDKSNITHTHTHISMVCSSVIFQKAVLCRRRMR